MRSPKNTGVHTSATHHDPEDSDIEPHHTELYNRAEVDHEECARPDLDRLHCPILDSHQENVESPKCASVKDLWPKIQLFQSSLLLNIQAFMARNTPSTTGTTIPRTKIPSRTTSVVWSN